MPMSTHRRNYPQFNTLSLIKSGMASVKDKISSQNVYLTENQRAFIERLAGARSPKVSVQQMARHIIDVGLKALAEKQQKDNEQ